MKTSTRIVARAGWAGAVATLLALNGCGSSKEPGSVAHARRNAGQSGQAADPAERAPQDMVSAVSVGKGGPPVELKFELREAPQAGQELDVDIVVLPDAATINRIYARFEGGQGLQLIEGGELAPLEKPAQGTVIRHVLRVLPKQDGIFTLSAAVSVDLADDSVTRIFTIPLIVGEGLPELTAKSEAADGQAAAGVGPKTH